MRPVNLTLSTRFQNAFAQQGKEHALSVLSGEILTLRLMGKQCEYSLIEPLVLLSVNNNSLELFNTLTPLFPLIKDLNLPPLPEEFTTYTLLQSKDPDCATKLKYKDIQANWSEEERLDALVITLGKELPSYPGLSRWTINAFEHDTDIAYKALFRYISSKAALPSGTMRNILNFCKDAPTRFLSLTTSELTALCPNTDLATEMQIALRDLHGASYKQIVLDFFMQPYMLELLQNPRPGANWILDLTNLRGKDKTGPLSFEALITEFIKTVFVNSYNLFNSSFQGIFYATLLSKYSALNASLVKMLLSENILTNIKDLNYVLSWLPANKDSEKLLTQNSDLFAPLFLDYFRDSLEDPTTKKVFRHSAMLAFYTHLHSASRPILVACLSHDILQPLTKALRHIRGEDMPGLINSLSIDDPKQVDGFKRFFTYGMISLTLERYSDMFTIDAAKLTCLLMPNSKARASKIGSGRCNPSPEVLEILVPNKIELLGFTTTRYLLAQPSMLQYLLPVLKTSVVRYLLIQFLQGSSFMPQLAALTVTFNTFFDTSPLAKDPVLLDILKFFPPKKDFQGAKLKLLNPASL